MGGFERAARRGWCIRAGRLLAAVTLLAAIVACSPDGPTANCGPTPPIFDRAAPDPDCWPDEPPPPPPPFPVCDGCGTGSGDPHVTTFDQQRYSLHAAAEVVAARSSVDDFEVQWRLVPSARGRRGGGAASIEAVAVRLAGERFTLTAGRDAPLRIDGEPVVVETDQSIVRPSGVAVLRAGDDWAVVGAGGAPSVVVSVYSRFVDVEVAVSDRHEGAVSGILGDADGDPADDLLLADGTMLSARPTPEELYPGFADAWRVDDETTLFDYEDGLGPDDYWDPAFPGTPLTLEDLDADQRAEAEAVCREAGVTDPAILDECVLDVAATGDDEYAAAAAARQARLSAGPRTSSTGAAAWDTILAGDDLAGGALPLDGEGHLLVPVTADGVQGLVALDVADGTTDWERRDVLTRCAPTVADGAVVAMTPPDGATGVGLVALDPSDGSDLRRYTPGQGEARLGECAGGLAVVGDVVVGLFGEEVRGFSADDLRPAWAFRLPAAAFTTPLPSVDGSGVWVTHRADGNEAVGVILLDGATGAILADGVVPDARIDSADAAVATEDGLVVSAFRPSDRAEGKLIRLEADGADVDVAWATVVGGADAAEGVDRNPARLAIAGSAVVGYTAGAFVSGFDLDDGTLRWTYRATSFNNNGSLVLGDENGRTFLSSFGGAWLEVLDADGDGALVIDPESLFGPDGADEVRAFGPAVDGLVFAASPAAGGGGTVVAAIEVGDAGG